MNKIEILILETLYISESGVEEYKRFFKSQNINEDDLYFAGSGDRGEAYTIDDGSSRVFKKTSSDTELRIAKEILEHPQDSLATVYFADNVGGDNIIVLEELDIDSDIENLWYEVESLLEELELPIHQINYLDMDELGDIDESVKIFIDQLSDVIEDAQRFAGMAADIKPDNLGYSKVDGRLKMFDVDVRGNGGMW